MEQGKQKKLLIVDDDPSLLATLVDFLSFEGYTCQCARSGEEALVAMRPFNPDLIILDMGMPGMGGTGFLDSITLEGGATLYPVLVLTARASMAEYFANKQIAGFLAKPADQEDLLLEIGRIVFEYPRTEEQAAGAKVLGEVLLAEPDADLRERLLVDFTRLGFHVTSCATGPEALEFCIRHKPLLAAFRLELPGMSADVLTGTLLQLASTADLPMLVYGTDAIGVDQAHVANLSLPPGAVVTSLNPAKIVDAATSLVCE